MKTIKDQWQLAPMLQWLSTLFLPTARHPRVFSQNSKELHHTTKTIKNNIFLLKIKTIKMNY